MQPPRRSSRSAYLENLRQPMPPGRKLWLISRNVAARFRGQRCCGHPGEPGC
ncbi:MAG TPA: hypothetical protein VET65_01850 [Candidatus Limnocylindrales bacterium]|nr:hypothetical protein [Candidatus Limnocylindrales bacterium]